MTKIIQYWNNEIPSDVRKLTETWQLKNPQFEYLRFNHQEALVFMEKHFSKHIYQSFKALTIPAMICDVFRVAVILKVGGIYVDCGTRCNRSIDELNLDFNKCTFVRKWNGWIWNGWICAKKGDPVIEKVWDKISDVLLSRKEGNIWALTGPKVIMDIVNEFTFRKLNYIESEVNTDFDNSLINIIEQKKSSSIFEIVNNLQHKKSAHWSKLQKIIPLFQQNYMVQAPNIFFDKHLVIHIGQHKTGSTAIQQSLNKLNTPISGILYPKTGLTFSGHHRLSDILQKQRPIVEGVIKELFNEISVDESHTVILSSEYFSSGNEIDFNKKRMDKIWWVLSLITKCFSSSEIIYYVRPQFSSIESRLNQSIKSRLCIDSLSINRFLFNPSLDYNLFDEVVRMHFPVSKITPRAFTKKALINGDIIADFNSFIPECELPTVITNKSIENKEEILSCLEINKMDIPVEDKMKRKKKVRDEFNKLKNGDNFNLLNNIQMDKIKNNYKESNKLFFEKYPKLQPF